MTTLTYGCYPNSSPAQSQALWFFQTDNPSAALRSFRDTAYTSAYSYHGVEADEHGRFTIEAVEGLSYMVQAHINMADGRQKHAEPVEVPAQGEAKK